MKKSCQEDAGNSISHSTVKNCFEFWLFSFSFFNGKQGRTVLNIYNKARYGLFEMLLLVGKYLMKEIAIRYTVVPWYSTALKLIEFGSQRILM